MTQLPVRFSRSDPDRHRARGDQVLDVAARLLLRLGYRRVTMEDIAAEANIGKGTVYLHWRTKNDLFVTVLLREVVELQQTLLAEMRRAPEEVRLHRVMRTLFLTAMRRPLAKALFTRDINLLGKLVHSDSGALRAQQEFSISVWRDYVGLLRSNGLMRADEPIEDQIYAMNSAVLGFYMMESLATPDEGISLPGKADLVGGLVRRAFEPPGPVDSGRLRAVAPDAIAMFERLRDDCGRRINADVGPDVPSGEGE